MTLAKLFDETIKALNASHVDYMIVGGFAVNFHGYVRSTSDLDIWVKPIEENKVKLCKAFIQLGYPEKNVDNIRALDFSKPFLFRIGQKPLAIEIFNTISGVQFQDAETNKILFSLPNETPVYFISLKDLLVNKMLRARLPDAVDVEELQKVNLLSKDKNIVRFIKEFFKHRND